MDGGGCPRTFTLLPHHTLRRAERGGGDDKACPGSLTFHSPQHPPHFFFFNYLEFLL